MSEPLISHEALADWMRATLREIEDWDDDEIVPDFFDVDERPLTVREVRERSRATLTKLAVEGHLPS